MAETKVTARRTLVLQFSLPGYRSASWSVDRQPPHDSFGRERPTQLQKERTHDAEHWQLEIDGLNAAETRDVLRALATQIDMAMSEGRL